MLQYYSYRFIIIDFQRDTRVKFKTIFFIKMQFINYSIMILSRNYFPISGTHQSKNHNERFKKFSSILH